jgi:hypothetical protein
MHREEVLMLTTSTSTYWSKEVLVARRSLVLALSTADHQITRRAGLWCSVCDLQYIEDKWEWWFSKRNRTAAMQLSSHVQDVHGNAINSTCGYKGSNQTIYRRLKWHVNKKVNMYLSKPYSGSRGIPSLILNISASWRWVVTITLRPLYSREIIREPIT